MLARYKHCRKAWTHNTPITQTDTRTGCYTRSQPEGGLHVGTCATTAQGKALGVHAQPRRTQLIEDGPITAPNEGCCITHHSQQHMCRHMSPPNQACILAVHAHLLERTRAELGSPVIAYVHSFIDSKPGAGGTGTHPNRDTKGSTALAAWICRGLQQALCNYHMQVADWPGWPTATHHT